jgi:hypothetical protein
MTLQICQQRHSTGDDLHQWHRQNEYGNGQRDDYSTGWAQHNITPMLEYEGFDFETLTYTAPDPPPPISATSISTTVAPVTTTNDSTQRRILTDEDRRRMCDYHKSHPSLKQTEIGGTSPALYPQPVLQLTLSSGV